jgi:hypothetical protein
VRIAREDGFGVDPAGIRRYLFAGQPVPPNIKTDIAVTDDEIGHLDPVTQGDLESSTADANREYVEREQTYRPDIEGSRQSKEVPDDIPDPDADGPVAGYVPQAVNDLTAPAAQEEDGSDQPLKGEALRDRAAELEIEGRSGMTAKELRDAVAAAEAEQA